MWVAGLTCMASIWDCWRVIVEVWAAIVDCADDIADCAADWAASSVETRVPWLAVVSTIPELRDGTCRSFNRDAKPRAERVSERGHIAHRHRVGAPSPVVSVLCQQGDSLGKPALAPRPPRASDSVSSHRLLQLGDVLEPAGEVGDGLLDRGSRVGRGDGPAPGRPEGRDDRRERLGGRG